MRRRSKYLWGGAAMLCLLAVPVCRWQNDGLMLTRYTAALPGLPAELEGLTLVQVSDLHSKRLGEGQEVLLDNGSSVAIPRASVSPFKSAWGNFWLEESWQTDAVRGETHR